MAKQKEKTVRIIDKRVYTEDELKKFDGMIQKYYDDYTMQTGEVIKTLNKKKLMIAYGALSKDGGVILTGIVYNKFNSIDSYDRPTRLEQFDNLWDQHSWWKGGEDWKKKSFEENQKMVEEKELLEDEPLNETSLF